MRTDAGLALANSSPLLMARGMISSASVVHKFGAVSGVGTAFKPVTTSQTYQTPTTAQALEIVSDSTDDNGATSPLGVGALSVKIYGITAWDAAETIETVTLNGTTAVALVNSWLRIYRVKVDSSGAYASQTALTHDSTITIQGTGGGDIWAQITSLDGVGLAQSEIAVYSVPAGKLAYMQHAEIWIESTKSANVVFFARENADVVTAPYSPRQAKIIMRSVIDSVETDPRSPYGPFVGPCDIGWLAEATLGTASVSIDFEIFLYDA